MKEDGRKVLTALTFVSFVSSTLIGCLVMGFFAGKWLDERFAIYPFGRAGGLFLAMLVAVRAIFLQIRENFLRVDKKDAR